MGKIVENFIKEFLEDEELIIHTGLLKHEVIEELEKKLRTGSPVVVAKFYEDLPEKIDFSILEDVSRKVKERDSNFVEDDDEEIIKFFSEEVEGRNLKDFFDIAGVLIHTLGTVEELENNQKEIPENVSVSTMLWVFLNMYEAILDTMTKELKNYYSKHKSFHSSKLSKIKERVSEGEHLMAGEIENQLVGMNVIEKENSSILNRERSRFFRNKLGHANVFYDDEVSELVLTNGERYSLKEFEKEFQILYQFLLGWLFSLNDKSPNIDETVEKFMTKISKNLSRDLIKIERGGYRDKFNKIIFGKAPEQKFDN